MAGQPIVLSHEKTSGWSLCRAIWKSEAYSGSKERDWSQPSHVQVLDTVSGDCDMSCTPHVVLKLKAFGRHSKMAVETCLGSAMNIEKHTAIPQSYAHRATRHLVAIRGNRSRHRLRTPLYNRLYIRAGMCMVFVVGCSRTGADCPQGACQVWDRLRYGRMEYRSTTWEPVRKTTQNQFTNRL